MWERCQSVGTVQLVQKEQGSVGDISLCHTVSLIRCFQFHLLSDSISLSPTKPGCDDSVTAPHKRPISKLKCGVLVKGGGRVGGLCVELVYVCVSAFICVCM